jgi:DNA-binding transcriptional LysR family regulator
MRFKGLDLNLIVAFEVLLEERSVSGAARRLNLSQPAVSATLARLRDYFGDDLLVPFGRRMIPTAYAESLRPLAVRMLEGAETLIATSRNFDPATSQRRFRVSVSDYVLTVLVTPLLEQMGALAPQIGIDVVPTGPQMLDQLYTGALDCIVSPEEFVPPDHPAELLFEDRHVVLGWDQNPALQGPLSMERFLELGHVVTSIGTGQDQSFAERHMQARDRRRIEVTVPSFSAVPPLLPGTMRIAVIQERLARFFVGALPLTIRPLPFDMPLLREVVQYHATRRNDAGVRWLVDLMKAAAKLP